MAVGFCWVGIKNPLAERLARGLVLARLGKLAKSI